MLIRHADARRDADACAAVYARYVRDSVVTLEEVPPTAEEFGRRIAILSATHAFLLAEEDEGADAGVVAGFAYAGPHGERPGYRWCADVSVYLDEDYHRRGIGTQLYSALFGLLERQGVWTVCSIVTIPNDASVGLHTSCGFRLVGVFHRVAFKHGAWRNVAWLERDLRPEGDFARVHSPPEPGPPARLA
jgi:phosphinothricin acetyltransferase